MPKLSKLTKIKGVKKLTKRVENMTDTHLLKYYIRKNGDTVETLANAIDIKRATLSAKINNRSDFKQSEIVAIGKRYKFSIEQCRRVFLSGWDL
jgi:plasmid maintenance system antidote protein VapI